MNINCNKKLLYIDKFKKIIMYPIMPNIPIDQQCLLPITVKITDNKLNITDIISINCIITMIILTLNKNLMVGLQIDN